MVKKIAAVHDICGFGRCSITTAISAISACGLQCCPVPTAVLSAHTAFQGVTSHDLTDTLPAYVDSLRRLSITFNAVYSGYLNSAKQVEQVLALINNCAAPDCLVIVDPVMGDNGKPYDMVFKDGFLPAIKRLCKSAHIITPNITEVAMLLDCDPAGFDISVEQAPKYLTALSELGPDTVVITGIRRGDDIGAGYFCKSSGEIGYASTPHVPQGYPGTGDLFASVLTCGILTGHSLAKSTQLACTFVSRCAEYTYAQKTPPIEGVLLEPLLNELYFLINT